MQHRRRGTPKFLKILTFVLIVAALGLLARTVATAAIFKVSSVQISGDTKNLVSDDIRRDVLGQNLLFFPEAQVRRQIGQNLLIGFVSFEREFPSTLKVTLTYRTPVLSWQSQQGRYLIDETGLAFQEASAEPVPQIADPSSQLKLGDSLSRGQVATTLRVMQALEGKGTVLTMNIQGQDVTIQLSNNTIVKMDAGGDLAQESAALQLILTQAKIEGRYPRTIDLRYSKPVVTF